MGTIEEIFLKHPDWGTKRIQEETVRLGRPYSKRQIRRKLSPLKTVHGNPKPERNRREDIDRDYRDDTAIITTKSWKITTVADALAKAEVDMDVWKLTDTPLAKINMTIESMPMSI